MTIFMPDLAWDMDIIIDNDVIMVRLGGSGMEGHDELTTQRE